MIYTVKRSYNDISLYDTLYIASNIMSYQSVPNIVILLFRTAFVYKNTNYAVPFMTLQPSSTLCVCVCVCACVRARTRVGACACTHVCMYMHTYTHVNIFVYIYTRTLLSVMSWRFWNKASHLECFGLVHYGWRWGKHQNLHGCGSIEKNCCPG